jgi:VanZ family protein
VNRRAALLFLLYLFAILYVSLYPAHPDLPPMRTELEWGPIFNRGQWIDVILNVLFYVPLGAAACIALRSGFRALFGATLICSLISLSVEYAQLSIPSRDADLRDFAANSLGALLGAGLAFVATREIVAPRLRALSPSRALFLALWIGWQGLLLLRTPWSVAAASHELIGLLVLAMVFAGKVPRAAAPLLLVWLAVEELRPFHFQGPLGPFSWIPFEGWFAGSPESYYGTIAAKFFLYTAVIWVMRRSGARMLWAFLAPALILAAGEWAQRYQPGRTPEVTDLVLLAAGGALLHLTGSDD